MQTASYRERRGRLETYFDRTAAEAWSRLTSDAPVGRIRATVRAGRASMAETLLGWLPPDPEGLRLLDAGCGTGTLARAAARRGAQVTAVDISPTLIELARERSAAESNDANISRGPGGPQAPAASGNPSDPKDAAGRKAGTPGGVTSSRSPDAPIDMSGQQTDAPGRVEYRVGDMLEAAEGGYDYVIAMDSLIHYAAGDLIEMIARLAAHTRRGLLLTFAPRTLPLAMMHAVGRLIPTREHRAPAIVPISETALERRLEAHPALGDWRIGRDRRIASGFYTSHALELLRR